MLKFPPLTLTHRSEVEGLTTAAVWLWRCTPWQIVFSAHICLKLGEWKMDDNWHHGNRSSRDLDSFVPFLSPSAPGPPSLPAVLHAPPSFAVSIQPSVSSLLPLSSFSLLPLASATLFNKTPVYSTNASVYIHFTNHAKKLEGSYQGSNPQVDWENIADSVIFGQ